ncbi:hypothetical protein DDB_G0275811 [Dictyostelium discoideum AX4]|uniref:Uncharacterized protein n=1 Tax=Dictyostelium discoideum TaxID=44689 RepID=Q553L5_DICDI|nr:hypothetical protein DDB_G0275811 [Dictyostelium discoideum AX4]EAL69656.1 hypothetical protein DDB_G0275811 [Dictyostelium discoideum AX4]|eukprot:XP_643398.1 hypothetical protein DDB_G0275811 [Dictyostelium discoideum AX4]
MELEKVEKDKLELEVEKPKELLRRRCYHENPYDDCDAYDSDSDSDADKEALEITYISNSTDILNFSTLIVRLQPAAAPPPPLKTTSKTNTETSTTIKVKKTKSNKIQEKEKEKKKEKEKDKKKEKI